MPRVDTSRLVRPYPTFAAIDFETANTFADSACAVAVVRSEGGRIVGRFFHLIRPPSRRFDFTHVHGLTWQDVADAPRFDAVWHEIRQMCHGVQFIAAHNAAFDEGVLRACCARAGLEVPEAPFACTVALARRAWGIYPTRLDCVAERLGIPLSHHDAASDAACCARIVLLAHQAGHGWVSAA
jgi:DNA polymerase-3 subunit epsilon